MFSAPNSFLHYAKFWPSSHAVRLLNKSGDERLEQSAAVEQKYPLMVSLASPEAARRVEPLDRLFLSLEPFEPAKPDVVWRNLGRIRPGRAEKGTGYFSVVRSSDRMLEALRAENS